MGAVAVVAPADNGFLRSAVACAPAPVGMTRTQRVLVITRAAGMIKLPSKAPLATYVIFVVVRCYLRLNP